MKYDEFAFVNQQLAGMLNDGIPLEGGLKRLCATMQRGVLRSELEKLRGDLSLGQPLGEAMAQRNLPDFYVKMIKVGAQSNDLPGVLLLLADYYHKVNSAWIRLKGLMVYPAIVLVLSFGLSLFIASFARTLYQATNQFHPTRSRQPPHPAAGQQTGYLWFSFWLPPAVLGAASATAMLVTCVPRIRRALHWRLPAFRETKLSQIAAAMRLMLQGGCSLNDALALAGELEQGTAAGRELSNWRLKCSSGVGKWADFTSGSRIFPPYFIWLVASAGEDLATGFQRAAHSYQVQASHRLELLLYAALPAALVCLGLMIMGQLYPIVSLVFGLSHLGEALFF